MGEQLTSSDVEKIEKEIDHRKLVVRKQAIEEVKEARAQGDLSENFEYYAAKKFKNQNESRIRYLERMLKNATIIEDHSSDDQIGINTIVTLYFPEDDMEETYKDGYALYYLAQAYRKNNDLDTAKIYYQKIVELYPGTERAANAQNYINIEE